MKRLLAGLLVVILLASGGFWVNWTLASPSHDRDWRADHERLARVREAGGGVYEVDDIRNWSYAPDGSASAEDWISATLDPEQLVQAYFIVEPFGSIPAIAHTMLSFEFADGSAYVVSVEARREVGEGYSAPKAAVLPIFEYLFVWSTERDMFANSEYWSEDDLYLYPLDIPLAHQKAVLRAMLDETRALEAAPRWYNTLFSNCTNVLARVVNRLEPGAVPFDAAWVLPGYSDEFLYDEGMIVDRGSFDATRNAAYISPHIPGAYAVTEPAAFSRRIREMMHGT